MSKTLDLTQRLISCPSVTPDDAGCQDILAQILSSLGFTIEHLHFDQVRNIWAHKGTQQPMLVFVGHTDVVTPGKLENWNTDPFTPQVSDDKLFGRGAADMKGGLAAMVVATENFLTQHPKFKGSIGFIITSDEEGQATNGTVKVMSFLSDKKTHIDWCIVGEPTSLVTVGDSIKYGRRGSINGEIKIIGKQGHTAHPHKANNPIHKFSPVLNELINIEWDKGNQYFPATSFQISNIASGTGAKNVIPSELTCSFNLRYTNELSAEIIMNRVKGILESHKLDFSLSWQDSGVPFVSNTGKLLESVQQVILEVTGAEPSLSTDGGTSDARFIFPTGAQIIELGPCNTSIHCANEFVSISDLETLTIIYEKILEKLFL